MHYRTIDDAVSRRLRAERVAALEAEHYRVGLLIEEGQGGDHAATLADLEHRIAGHIAVLEPPTDAAPDTSPGAHVGSDDPAEHEQPHNGALVDLDPITTHR